MAMTRHELKNNSAVITNASVTDGDVEDFEAGGFFNALMLTPPVRITFYYVYVTISTLYCWLNGFHNNMPNVIYTRLWISSKDRIKSTSLEP